jgi:hypothetical protein
MKLNKFTAKPPPTGVQPLPELALVPLAYLLKEVQDRCSQMFLVGQSHKGNVFYAGKPPESISDSGLVDLREAIEKFWNGELDNQWRMMDPEGIA